MPSMGRRKWGGVAGPTNLSDLPHSSHPEYPAERVHVASEFRKTKTSLPQGGEVSLSEVCCSRLFAVFVQPAEELAVPVY